MFTVQDLQRKYGVDNSGEVSFWKLNLPNLMIAVGSLGIGAATKNMLLGLAILFLLAGICTYIDYAVMAIASSKQIDDREPAITDNRTEAEPSTS